jgi:hypothetical protein
MQHDKRNAHPRLSSNALGTTELMDGSDDFIDEETLLSRSVSDALHQQ